jgi:hypothetical protein
LTEGVNHFNRTVKLEIEKAHKQEAPPIFRWRFAILTDHWPPKLYANRNFSPVYPSKFPADFPLMEERFKRFLGRFPVRRADRNRSVSHLITGAYIYAIIMPIIFLFNFNEL